MVNGGLRSEFAAVHHCTEKIDGRRALPYAASLRHV